MAEKKVNKKKFVHYKEGAELYSMCQSKFEDLAKDAGAIYKVNKLVLVNCEIFEEYLETLSMADLELLSIGLINDMYAESRNDDCKYAQIAAQDDFDRFNFENHPQNNKNCG